MSGVDIMPWKASEMSKGVLKSHRLCYTGILKAIFGNDILGSSLESFQVPSILQCDARSQDTEQLRIGCDEESRLLREIFLSTFILFPPLLLVSLATDGIHVGFWLLTSAST